MNSMDIANWLMAPDGKTAITSLTVGDLMIPMIVSAVLALVMCFFGLKLIRFWNVLCGLAVGAGIGLGIGTVARLDSQGGLIAIGAGALIMAILAGVFKKFGAFWLCLLGIAGVAGGILLWIMDSGSILFVLICIGAALVFAILTMIWFEPFIILVTAFCGGSVLASAVSGLAGIDNIFITSAVGIVAAIIGIVVQFMMKSKEIAKKQVKHAEAIKEEISKEAEVEQARLILDDDEDEDDE